jgi:hypothetical protein
VTVGELENVEDSVGWGVNVPDEDCDTVRVLQGDAEVETEVDPHGLDDGDEDTVVGPDALADPLIETVTDIVYDGVDDEEIENVVEIVDNEEIVPDPDCETVPVPQCDALWEPDAVLHALADVINDGDAKVETLADPQ